MSPAAVGPARKFASIAAPPDDQRFIQRLASFAIWTLPILTFTSPGRPSPSSMAFLDGLAVVKLLILLTVFSGGLLVILRTLQQPATRLTLAPLIPFLIFLGWAILSVLWTPLPAVTIGQSGGLASLLVLASLVGLIAQHENGVERVLKTLSRSLLAFSLFVLAIHLFWPNFSGLDRRMLVHGTDGVIHPTAAGANSSLGLLLAALCVFVGRYRWAGRMAIASVAIHGAILFYASSRTALGMGVVTVAAIVFLYTDIRVRALILVGLGLFSITVMLCDPSFGLLLDSDNAGIQYITRGQNADQLKGVSGRHEMWSKVWNEYKKSVVFGHGYFITSETGALEVWYMKANHTAHNIYLQVLVSTGAIGFVLFVVAILRLAVGFLSLLKFDTQARNVCIMLAFVVVWYLGWSMLCVSFMGPVRSESVFFFTFVGIGLGQLARAVESGIRKGVGRHPPSPVAAM